MGLTIKYSKLIESSIVVSIFCLVFFYDAFIDLVGFFDELLALISFFIILSITLFAKKIYLYKNERIVVFLLFFIAIIGLISNYRSYRLGYETRIEAILGDMITFYKAFVVYFGIRLLSKSFSSQRTINTISKYSEWGFFILLLLLVIDIFAKIYPQPPRYGIHSFQLFFGHPSRYSFAFSFIFLMLFNKYLKLDKKYLLFILLIGLTSLRVKYFGFVMVAFFMLFYRKLFFKIPKKAFFIVLGGFIGVMFLLFREQISLYFSFNQIKDAWSRGVILITSFNIGNDFFPLGTGFGSYASYFSGKYYSWVYDLYGINNVWGISRFYWGFMADQFWPMVLGQFGYFGLIAYGIIIYQYIILFLRHLKSSTSNSKNKNYMFVALLGMLLLLIDSTSDAIFTQNRAVVMFILFALLINSQVETDKIVKE